MLTLATSSAAPVIEAGWVRPGTHVCTLGPKEKERHEFPPELAGRCALIVTDSPAQQCGRSVCVQNPPPRREEDITFFLSVGLAGTEVLLARELLRAAQP